MCDEKYDIILVGSNKIRYYLIDYENVHQAGFVGIEELKSEDNIIIFYSLNADSMPFSLFEALHTTPANLVLNKVDIGEKNALDIQLATYCGYLIGENKNVEVHIISRDRGYEFIRTFWNKKGIKVVLSPNIAGIEKNELQEPQPESANVINKKDKVVIIEQKMTSAAETTQPQTASAEIKDIDSAIASLKVDKETANAIKQIFNNYKKCTSSKRKQAISTDLCKKYGGEKTKIYYKAIKPFIK